MSNLISESYTKIDPLSGTATRIRKTCLKFGHKEVKTNFVILIERSTGIYLQWFKFSESMFPVFTKGKWGL